MNKRNERGHSRGSDKMITLIIVIVVIAVLGLGVYATYGEIANNIRDNKIASGEIAETVEYAAEQEGMTVEDYLELFSLDVSDDVNVDTPVDDFYGYMTLENYMNMANEGNEEEVDIDSMIEEWGLTGQVTKDTQWKDVELLIPVGTYFGDETLEQYKQAYNIGDEVNSQTPYGEFQEIVEQKIEEMSNATAAPATETPADEAAETEEAQTDSEATE
ncbi:MAG: hypothetical protein LIO59_05450 [Oscillospiraceae bacterium]|nr:hypothetical protein [Oscillospiraceae bacterium]